MFIWQLAQGDIAYENGKSGNYGFTDGFSNRVDNHFTQAQFDDFVTINTDLDKDDMKTLLVESSFKVIKTNRDVVMAQGYHQTDGAFDTSTMVYRIYKDTVQIECTEVLSPSCQGNDWTELAEAERTFTNNIRSSQDSSDEVTHYIINGYWYTNDLVEEFDSVSTNMHRVNARLALTVQLLGNTLDEGQIVDLYD
jgi:hypothetical protein